MPPKKETTNEDLRTEIENTDLKNENLATKSKNVRTAEKIYGDKTTRILDDIAVFEPGKNAQIAAKKVSQKYKKIREANAKKRYKIRGEMAVGDTIETDQGKKINVILPPSKISSLKAAKKIKKKYNKIRRKKIKSQKIVASNKKNKILKEIDAVDKIKTACDKKRTRITAQKILKKYKNMKRPKRTYLVNKEDIDTIDYSEPPQEDLFAGESIINAANKLIDFKQFKKEQEKRLQEYNDQLLNNAETVNYVYDVNLDDVRENKNSKMAPKKISDKYKKTRRKRKATTSVPTLHRTSKPFFPDKRSTK